jgi:hypothetical protein
MLGHWDVGSYVSQSNYPQDHEMLGKDHFVSLRFPLLFTLLSSVSIRSSSSREAAKVSGSKRLIGGLLKVICQYSEVISVRWTGRPSFPLGTDGGQCGSLGRLWSLPSHPPCLSLLVFGIILFVIGANLCDDINCTSMFHDSSPM